VVSPSQGITVAGRVLPSPETAADSELATIIGGGENKLRISVDGTSFKEVDLIPSCILKSNSHIGEVGQGTDAVGISSELGEACAERVLQSIKGRERLVGQDLLPQFFPDMLGWIEFRTAGRLGQ